jgi:hypothetical protein
MPTTPQQSQIIDLHGKSLTEAKHYVTATIQDAIKQRISFLRIITGKGNHINKSGNRGVLYKRLPTWLEHPELKPFIESIEHKEGSYLLIINPISAALPKNSSGNSHHPMVHFEPIREPKLFQAIKKAEALEQKINTMTQLIDANPLLIYETDTEANTVLMAAAASNHLPIIEFLLKQEAIHFINPKLLKQTNDEGYTVLMTAIAHNYFQLARYLLEKAPSLLKKKCSNGDSVLKIAKNSDNPQQSLDFLCEYLSERKRDTGYTGVWAECKKYQAMIQRKERNQEDDELLKSNPEQSPRVHAWFFMDRMLDFLDKLKYTHGKMSAFAKTLPAPREGFLSLRAAALNLLAQHTKFKKLFLKFNHFKKPLNKRKFKHAIDYSKPPPFRKVSKGRKLTLSNKALPSILLDKALTYTAASQACASRLRPANHPTSKQEKLKLPLLFSYPTVVAGNPQPINAIFSQDEPPFFTIKKKGKKRES